MHVMWCVFHLLYRNASFSHGLPLPYSRFGALTLLYSITQYVYAVRTVYVYFIVMFVLFNTAASYAEYKRVFVVARPAPFNNYILTEYINYNIKSKRLHYITPQRIDSYM